MGLNWVKMRLNNKFQIYFPTAKVFLRGVFSISAINKSSLLPIGLVKQKKVFHITMKLYLQYLVLALYQLDIYIMGHDDECMDAIFHEN